MKKRNSEVKKRKELPVNYYCTVDQMSHKTVRLRVFRLISLSEAHQLHSFKR